jgi:hypothetical protein
LFPAAGVKPEVVERWTLYAVTPTLSVDVSQFRLTLLPDAAAWRLPGADGGCESAPGAGKRTIAATEGTPLVSTKNSM